VVLDNNEVEFGDDGDVGVYDDGDNYPMRTAG
jgi:hypothetical protein